MKKNIFISIICLSLWLAPGWVYAMGLLPPTPPVQPDTGYGSSENYISESHVRYQFGNPDEGSEVYYYIPDILKHGASAPVVVFLHGFMAAAPELYEGHIKHLTRQGIIVIFPQYNLSNIFADTDQNLMLDRAITGTQKAFDIIGGLADQNRVYLYGHSAGALLAICWAGRGGIDVNGIVTADGSLDPRDSMPEFARDLITLLDYKSLAPATTAPVMILWGTSDIDFAPKEQQEEAYNALTGAVFKTVYAAQSDEHGRPALIADHVAPLQLFGIEDTLDSRYFYAALDAVMDGQTDLRFDFGAWSDGVAVKPVLTLCKDVEVCRIPD